MHFEIANRIDTPSEANLSCGAVVNWFFYRVSASVSISLYLHKSQIV